MTTSCSARGEGALYREAPEGFPHSAERAEVVSANVSSRRPPCCLRGSTRAGAAATAAAAVEGSSPSLLLLLLLWLSAVACWLPRCAGVHEPLLYLYYLFHA